MNWKEFFISEGYKTSTAYEYSLHAERFELYEYKQDRMLEFIQERGIPQQKNIIQALRKGAKNVKYDLRQIEEYYEQLVYKNFKKNILKNELKIGLSYDRIHEKYDKIELNLKLISKNERFKEEHFKLIEVYILLWLMINREILLIDEVNVSERIKMDKDIVIIRYGDYAEVDISPIKWVLLLWFRACNSLNYNGNLMFRYRNPSKKLEHLFLGLFGEAYYCPTDIFKVIIKNKDAGPV